MKYIAIYTDTEKTFPPVAFFEHENWARAWALQTWGYVKIREFLFEPIFIPNLRELETDAVGEGQKQSN